MSIAGCGTRLVRPRNFLASCRSFSFTPRGSVIAADAHLDPVLLVIVEQVDDLFGFFGAGAFVADHGDAIDRFAVPVA